MLRGLLSARTLAGAEQEAIHCRAHVDLPVIRDEPGRAETEARYCWSCPPRHDPQSQAAQVSVRVGDGDARTDALQAINDDTFPGFQAGPYEPLASHQALGCDGPYFNLVVGVDHHYARLPCRVAYHAALGDQQCLVERGHAWNAYRP